MKSAIGTAHDIVASERWIRRTVSDYMLHVNSGTFDWNELEMMIFEALTAYADEKLEEAAKEVESMACGKIGASTAEKQTDINYIHHIAKCVRALKSTPAPGGASK